MKLQLDQSLDESLAKAAVRGKQLHDSAKAAAHKSNKVHHLCYAWIRDNKPELFKQFREQAGYTKAYIRRPELIGKRPPQFLKGRIIYETKP